MIKRDLKAAEDVTAEGDTQCSWPDLTAEGDTQCSWPDLLPHSLAPGPRSAQGWPTLPASRAHERPEESDFPSMTLQPISSYQTPTHLKGHDGRGPRSHAHEGTRVHERSIEPLP